MLIQCPSCNARTQLADGHAGVKVRCGECGRVFVPRADREAGRGRRGRLVLGGFVGFLALIALVVFLQTKGSASAAPTGAPTPADE